MGLVPIARPLPPEAGVDTDTSAEPRACLAAHRSVLRYGADGHGDRTDSRPYRRVGLGLMVSLAGDGDGAVRMTAPLRNRRGCLLVQVGYDGEMIRRPDAFHRGGAGQPG